MNCTDLGGASSGDVGVIDVNAMTRTLLEETDATKENTKPLSSNVNGEWKDKIHHLDVADHGKDTSSEWKDKIHHLDVEDHGQDESKLWKTNIHHLDVANHPVVSVADASTSATADVNFNVNLNSKKSSAAASVEGEKTRAAGVDSNSSAAPVDDETIIGMTEVLVGADASMSGVPTTMTPVLEKVIDPSALVRQQEMLDAELSKSTASAEHSGSAASSSFATTASDAPSGIAATTWKDATPTKPLHDPPTSSKVVDGAASTASTASFDSAVSASGGATTAAAAVAVGGGDGKDSGVGRDAGGVALTSAATTSQPGDSIAAKTGSTSTVGTPSDAIEAAAASTTPVDDSPVAVVESKEVTESSKPDAEIAARVAAAEDEFDETLGGRVVIPTTDEAAARSMANVARAEKSANKSRRRSSTASHRGILGGKKVRHPLRPSLEGE